MGELISTIITFGIMYVVAKYPEWKADNHILPPGYHTDYSQMTKDEKDFGHSYVCDKQSKGGYDVANGDRNKIWTK